MPPSKVRKSRRQRGRRRRVYLLGTLIIVIAVGWYVYASAQSANNRAPATGIVYARLNTSQGPIEVELYQSKTPQTVANFVNLAKQGFYNDLVWHRIVKNPNVIQTGDPNTRDGGGSQWGSGGSSQTVPLEIDSSLHNTRGYLGMARGTDRNSGTSQFYINLGDNSYLDGDYTVFGKVISGIDAADTIANHPVDSPSHGQPLEPYPFLTSVIISNSP
jgi:cyclophilin family peptidyl-prolyl cis-trans isomerase